MKKIFLYILAGSLCFSACKKDDDPQTFVEPDDVAVRNTYDDQAIQKFLNDNYLDTQGNIKAFSSTDTTDDNEKKLADLNPVKLPSGVIYIVRAGAQPTPPGTAIGTTDVLKMMVRASYYLATNTDGTVALTPSSVSPFLVNTINGGGSPISDPMWYYVKNKTLTDATTDVAKQRKYYEIEGFQEGLKYFKGFQNMADGDAYNLQGVILVPSRAAFGREAHYNYTGYSLQNRTFVFNFQIYDTKTRTAAQQ